MGSDFLPSVGGQRLVPSIFHALSLFIRDKLPDKARAAIFATDALATLLALHDKSTAEAVTRSCNATLKALLSTGAPFFTRWDFLEASYPIVQIRLRLINGCLDKIPRFSRSSRP